MERFKPLTEAELTAFLEEIGIRPEGIQAILKTFITEKQRGMMKGLVKDGMEDGLTAKKAIDIVWYGLWKANICHKEKIGPQPKEEDFLKL